MEKKTETEAKKSRGAAKKKPGLEESFEILNGYVEKMEQKDISLEESFSLYTKGMELVKNCGQMIDKIEKELIVLDEEQEA